MVSGVIDELLQVATSHKCNFASDFKEKTMQNMLTLTPEANIMYQDFVAKRPMEIETYLGTPLRFARNAQIVVPRLQALYAILHHLNTTNQNRPPPQSPAMAPPAGRVTSAPPPPRPPMNGQGRGGRMSGMGMQMPPQSRRGPPPLTGIAGDRLMATPLDKCPGNHPSRRTILMNSATWSCMMISQRVVWPLAMGRRRLALRGNQLSIYENET